MQHVSTFLKGHHEAEHILYNTQKGIHKTCLFLQFKSQFHKTVFHFHYKYGLRTIVKIRVKNCSSLK